MLVIFMYAFYFIVMFLALVYLIIELYNYWLDWSEERKRIANYKRFKKLYRI